MADDKTRIVARDGGKTAGRADAKSAERPITFYCSNGHRISVPVKLAGKRGTCSKCGIALTIPMAGSSPVRPPHAGSPATEPAAAEPAQGGHEPDQAEPEGLPVVADEAETVESAPEQPTADEGEELQKLFASVAETGGADEREGSSASVEPAPIADQEVAAEPLVEGVLPAHPTSQLVARLWAEREHGGIVELHLTGGSVILPEWYEPLWSRGTHGLFASQAADGTVTLTAVAWDSIQKVVVRQVQGLPDGMFE
jgi:hypothetical protein